MNEFNLELNALIRRETIYLINLPNKSCEAN